MFLWPAEVSSLGCVSSQLLSHPRPACWERESGVKTSFILCKYYSAQPKHWCVPSTISVRNSKHSTTCTAMKKINPPQAEPVNCCKYKVTFGLSEIPVSLFHLHAFPPWQWCWQALSVEAKFMWAYFRMGMCPFLPPFLHHLGLWRKESPSPSYWAKVQVGLQGFRVSRWNEVQDYFFILILWKLEDGVCLGSLTMQILM